MQVPGIQYITAVCLALLSVPLAAKQVGGVTVEDQIDVHGRKLLLNGAGLRKKFGLVSVYAAGLYLPQKTRDAAAVLVGKRPLRILLVMTRSVDGDTMLNSFHEALQDNLSVAESEVIKGQVAQLDALFKKLQAGAGDTLAIDVGAQDEVSILLNNQVQGTLAGPAIGTALIKIWLGHKPVQSSLKAELLGD